jgi:multimeric flavodoxin WrbA
MKILVLYGSSRENGNSEMLADIMVEGLECTKTYLRQKNIEPIEDKRHTEEGFQPIDDDYDEIVDQLLHHDILIFATPLYWYGMSGRMKNFFDRWSQSLRDKRFNFKESIANKKAYVIITGGDHPRFKGLPLIQQFQYIFDFVSLDFVGYIIGEGNQPGDILKDHQALFEAKRMNQELRQLATKI